MVLLSGSPSQETTTIPHNNIKKRSVPYFTFPPDLPTELYDDVSPPEQGFNIIDRFIDPVILEKIPLEDLVPQSDNPILMQKLYQSNARKKMSKDQTKSVTKPSKPNLDKLKKKKIVRPGMIVYGNDTPVYTYELYTPDHSIAHSEACQLKRLKMMILVASDVGNAGFRSAIRDSWGRDLAHLSVGLMFMLGIGPNNDSLGEIVAENAIHKDIILGNFVDSYSNLTLKTLSMLDWFSRHCRRVPIFAKADDDVFINIPKLVKFISNPKRIKAKYTIWGYVQRGIVPRRKEHQVSVLQYPKSKYPDFMLGALYFMTSDCVKLLFNVAQPEPYVGLENVFVTGILANRLNLTKEHVPNITEDYRTVEWMSGDNDNLKNTLAVHLNGRILHEALWRMLTAGQNSSSGLSFSFGVLLLSYCVTILVE